MSKRRKKRKYVPYRPKQILGNSTPLMVRAEMIRFKDFRISGFAGANTLAGQELPILVRASITSDERDFHVYMEGISNFLSDRAREVGALFFIDALVGFVLVVHKDKIAELHVNGMQMVVEILAKRDLKAGEMVLSRDIADVRRVKYQNITFLPSDKVFICFKVGWKFGMFFDLADNRELDIDRMELDLGSLYRRLKYQALYEALAEQATVDRMTEAGWFPFIEIMGGDFDPLLKAYRGEFDIENKEKSLIEKFTPDRIDKIGERWWKNPMISKHKTVLQAGLDAFKKGDFILSIKTIVTEIEGILADVHLAEKGSAPKTEELLKHAVERGNKKAGGEASLFFPKDFLKYLLEITYASFDRKAPAEAGAFRHTVGHGFASGDTYTPARALQIILTLDQIAFYL